MRYAHFDPATGDILNWMDTGALSYASMPPDSELLAVSAEEWGVRYDAGRQIVSNGKLVPYVEPVDPNADIKRQIWEIEATVTQRRIREATLGTDDGWLKATDDQIVALRKQLK